MKVGIIGAGIMGRGIAQAFAAYGNDVYLCDTDKGLAEKGLEGIKKNVTRFVDKGKLEKAKGDSILGHIKAEGLEALKDRDLVIEVIYENMQAKKDLFAKLQAICPKETMFATNTSSLSITELGQALDRPLVGMHFFNPADFMELVEIIPGINTPEETVQRAMDIAAGIGKTPIRVQESPAFVVNRILTPMINEAIGLLAEGIASKEDIDNAMKLGASHLIGPLALADLVGLDVVLAVMEVIYTETCDSKYRPHPLLRKMVRGGLLGRKSGKGFYDYN